MGSARVVVAAVDSVVVDDKFLGVVRASLLWEENGQVARALLADNVFFHAAAMISELRVPWYHVAVSWRQPDSDIDLGAFLDAAVGRPNSSTLGTLAESFDELPALSAGGILTRDPDHARGWAVQHMRSFDVWTAVACMRYRVRIIEEAVWRMSQGGEGRSGILPLHRLLNVPDAELVAYESPHFEHMNRPMSEDGRGKYRYIVPVKLWPALVAAKGA